MSNRVLVFGGSGFIGTHCIRRLAAAVPGGVVSVDLLPPRERLDGVEYRIGDVRDLTSFAVEGEVARIYNFAAIHKTPGHPADAYYETNIAGALEVTRLAERIGCGHIVFTSSISVYGAGEATKDETSPPSPNTPYGYSKRLAERIHLAWLERSADRRLVIVRPAAVFGAGERGNFTRMAALLKKGAFLFPGRTDTIKACIYVEDLLDAIAHAEAQGQRGVLFNGCYPQRYTIGRIVDCLRAAYFPKARTFVVPLGLLLAGARVLQALDLFHVGIHPDRIYKLVRSTDIVPGWMTRQGLSREDALENGFARWHDESHGTFE